MYLYVNCLEYVDEVLTQAGDITVCFMEDAARVGPTVRVNIHGKEVHIKFSTMEDQMYGLQRRAERAAKLPHTAPVAAHFRAHDTDFSLEPAEFVRWKNVSSSGLTITFK